MNKNRLTKKDGGVKGLRAVAPPGIFIGGGGGGGQNMLGSGAEPRKFFFDHALYFGYKRDQRPLHRLRSR